MSRKRSQIKLKKKRRSRLENKRLKNKRDLLKSKKRRKKSSRNWLNKRGKKNNLKSLPKNRKRKKNNKKNRKNQAVIERCGPLEEKAKISPRPQKSNRIKQRLYQKRSPNKTLKKESLQSSQNC